MKAFQDEGLGASEEDDEDLMNDPITQIDIQVRILAVSAHVQLTITAAGPRSQASRKRSVKRMHKTRTIFTT